MSALKTGASLQTRVGIATGLVVVGDLNDQFQASAHRPLGIVLVRLRVAEIDEHAVAQIFCYEPVEAAHCVGDALLVGRNNLAKVLRVHASRERRRADEVREHHRDLAALRCILWLWLRRRDSRFNGP